MRTSSPNVSTFGRRRKAGLTKDDVFCHFSVSLFCSFYTIKAISSVLWLAATYEYFCPSVFLSVSHPSDDEAEGIGKSRYLQASRSLDEVFLGWMWCAAVEQGVLKMSGVFLSWRNLMKCSGLVRWSQRKRVSLNSNEVCWHSIYILPNGMTRRGLTDGFERNEERDAINAHLVPMFRSVCNLVWAFFSSPLIAVISFL